MKSNEVLSISVLVLVVFIGLAILTDRVDSLLLEFPKTRLEVK